jgi:DNA-directed RNA polymerase subunit M/transcription elongation factor TFIIS
MRMRVPDVSAVKDRHIDGHEALDASAPEVPSPASSCPRCGGFEAIRLDRLRQQDNVCYRCRTCGHIFSPTAGREAAS